MYKILIADKLNKEAEDVFSNNGIQTIVKTGLDAKSLIQELKNCDGLVVRSATKVVKECVYNGVLPVYTFKNSIKLGPPLTITKDAIKEALDVISDCIQKVENEQI